MSSGSGGAPASLPEAVSVRGAQTVTGPKVLTAFAPAATQVTGDLHVATSATATGVLPDVALGQVLKSGGAGAPPAYAAIGGTTAATTPAFTGTAPTTFSADLVTGTGFATSGQVVTTTASFTATLNQYANCWLIGATKGPCLIVSNTAVTGAPLVLTVYGAAPSTDAGTWKILIAPTPVGSVASHTHGGTGLT